MRGKQQKLTMTRAIIKEKCGEETHKDTAESHFAKPIKEAPKADLINKNIIQCCSDLNTTPKEVSTQVNHV